MNLTRRNVCRAGALLIVPAYLSPLFGQGNKQRPTLRPSEPDEFDMQILLLHTQPSRAKPPTSLRDRRQEFSSCLKQVFDAATRLDKMIGQLPVPDVFSVQMYKEAELLERLAKQLKRLTKG